MADTLGRYQAMIAAADAEDAYYAEKANKLMAARNAQRRKAMDVAAQSAGDYVTPSGEIDRSMGRAGTYGSQVVRGFGSMLGAVPKGVADITQLATGYDPKGLREAGEGIDEFFQQADVNPEYAEEFGGKVAHGVGTTLGFFAGGAGGAAIKGVGLASKLARGGAKLTMPVTSGINEMTEDFRRTMGRDPTQEELATLVPSGTALGAMEYLPIAGGLSRFGKVRKGKDLFGGKVGGVAMGTAEEFIQEGSQQIGQNYAAKAIAKYDKDRDVFEGLGEAASIGGASGFIINSALMLAGVKLRGSESDARKGVAEEDQEDMADEVSSLTEEGRKMAVSDAEKTASLRRDISAKNKELAKAKESEATNPEEVKAIQEELDGLTQEFFALRDAGVRQETIADVEGAPLPEEAFGEVTEEIELGDERIGAAQMDLDAELERLALDDAAAATEVEEGVEEISGDVLPRPPGPYAKRPGARPAPTKKEMVTKRIHDIYGDTLALEKGDTIFQEEWNAGPIPGQYPGRNFIGQSEAETTADLDLTPEMQADMKADTQEANEVQKEEAKVPKKKKAVKKKAVKGRAVLPAGVAVAEEKPAPPAPVSVAAKRGKAAKTAVSKIADARKDVQPVSPSSTNKVLQKAEQDISDWADQKGTVPAGEYARTMKTLKQKMVDEMISDLTVEERTQKEIRKIKARVNRYIKKVTPITEITEANKEEAERAAPTSAESLREELMAIPGATEMTDGGVSVPVDNTGTVDGPKQMKELFQNENLSSIRTAHSMLSTETVNNKEAQNAYLIAIHRYIMSKIKQPRTTADNLLAAEVRMEVRDTIELLSNEGILPPQFTSPDAQATLTTSVLEEYKGGDPLTAQIVSQLEEKYPLNEKGKGRNMKGGIGGNKFNVKDVNKESLNEALTQTGLHIKSVNLNGDATIVNANKHTKDMSPTQVLGNAPSSIPVSPAELEDMTTPPEVTAPPARETPLFKQEEADKVAPVTDPRTRRGGRLPSAEQAATRDEAAREATTDEGRETIDLANITDAEVDAMKGPEVTDALRELAFLDPDEIPHKIVERKELLRNAIGEAQDYLGPTATAPTDLGVTEDTGEQIVPAQEGGAGSRLAAAVKNLKPIDKKEVDSASLDPTRSPFPSEGATPRTESGEISVEEETATQLQQRFYDGEELSEEEMHKLVNEFHDEQVEEDFISTEEGDILGAPSLKDYAGEAYIPSGNAVVSQLTSLQEKMTGDQKPKFGDVLKTLIDTLPVGSSERALAEVLLSKGLTTTVELTDILNSREGVAIGGDYNVDTQHIRINRQNLPGDVSQVLMHEGVHAVTSHWFRTNAKFREEITKLYAAARKVYDGRGGKLDGVDYAMTSPEEFLAEMFANPVVQKFANDITYKSKKHGRVIRFMRGFLDAVRNMLGIDMKHDTVLYQTLLTGYRGFRNQNQIDAAMGTFEVTDADVEFLDPFYNMPMRDLAPWTRTWIKKGTDAPNFKKWAGANARVVEPDEAGRMLRDYQKRTVIYETIAQLGGDSIVIEEQKAQHMAVYDNQIAALEQLQIEYPSYFIEGTSPPLISFSYSSSDAADEAVFNRAQDIWTAMQSTQDILENLEAIDTDNMPDSVFTTGTPTVVRSYHGSNDNSMRQPALEELGTNTEASSAKAAMWSSHNPQVSNAYAGETVHERPVDPFYSDPDNTPKDLYNHPDLDQPVTTPIRDISDISSKEVSVSKREWIAWKALANVMGDYNSLDIVPVAKISGEEMQPIYSVGLYQEDNIRSTYNETRFTRPSTAREQEVREKYGVPSMEKHAISKLYDPFLADSETFSYEIRIKNKNKEQPTVIKLGSKQEVSDYVIEKTRDYVTDTNYRYLSMMRDSPAGPPFLGRNVIKSTIWSITAKKGGYKEKRPTNYPQYVKFENPLVFHYGDTAWGEGPALTPILVNAKERGHDGVIIVGIADGGPSAVHYATFKPEENIRSLFNKGKFESYRNAAALTEEGLRTPQEQLLNRWQTGETLNAEETSKLFDIEEVLQAPPIGATPGEHPANTGKKTPRPYTPSWADRAVMKDIMVKASEMPEAFMDSAHGWAAKHASSWFNKFTKSNMFDFYRMMGGLSDQSAYMTGRGKSMGLASQFDEVANFFGQEFSKLDDADQAQLTDYLTNRDYDPADLPEHFRDDAVWAKTEIMKQADALVELDFLDENINEHTAGSYLPRMYMMFMQLPEGANQMSTTGGSGAKTGLQYYLKQHAGLDTNTQEALGFVNDPALRVAQSISTVGRDIAILDFLKNINDFAITQEENPWVFPGGNETFQYQMFNEDNQRIETLDKSIPEAYKDLLFGQKQMVTHGPRRNIDFHENFYTTQLEQMKRQLNGIREGFGDLNFEDYREIGADKRNGALKGKWVRKEIYDDLRANTFAFTTGDPSWGEKMLGQNSALTKGNRIWKATKTVWNLPAHGRNAVSNFINWDISTDTSTVELMNILWNTGGDWLQARRAGDKYPNNSRVWRLADELGITETTWTAQEAVSFQKEWQKLNRASPKDDWIDQMPANSGMKSWFKEKMPHMRKGALHKLEFLARMYQGNETLFKVAKLTDVLNKMEKQYPNIVPGSIEEKAMEALAIQEAQRAIFDYSNVTKTVKYFRNAPIGAPFLSFAYLAAPRMFESTVKHPVKMMKYLSLPYIMGEFAASMGVFDDDDWETAKNKAPGFLKDKHTLLPMPWKDENGDPIIWDLAYYLPYAPFLETAHQYKNILGGQDTETGLHTPLLRNFGILSGPVPDILTALKTNIDPFTQQAIVNPRGSSGEKAMDVFSYSWSVAMPTFLSHHGLAGNMYKQMTGKNNVNPRTLEERASFTEGLLRGLGVSVYSYDPDDSRGVNARYYKSLLNQQKAADKKKLRKMHIEGANFEQIAKERKNAADRQKIYRKNYTNYLEETQ